MDPVQKFLIKSAKAALEIAQEVLGNTASIQELEDYALELMVKGAALNMSTETTS